MENNFEVNIFFEILTNETSTLY